METSSKQQSIIDRRNEVRELYDKLPTDKKGVTAIVTNMATKHKVTMITIWDDIKKIKTV